MALDLQTCPPPSHEEQITLDGVLRHHLTLEPQTESGTVAMELDKRKTNRKRTISQPPMKFSTQATQHSVKSTIEADNKRRPGIMKMNASRYESPPPDPPDPNSEAKSVTISRMQSSLQEWDKQLKKIMDKKSNNDSICSSELATRDKKFADLEERYSTEHKLRMKAEKQRDKLTSNLRNTTEELSDHKEVVEQLQTELVQYQTAYQETEAQKAELEAAVSMTTEQLQTSEGMRRRLNDQVTELQGQLAIEEQRSKLCNIL